MTSVATHSAALIGVTGRILDIEATAEPGPAGLHLIGIPERSLWPARERMRAGVLNSGIAWPEAKVTVSVHPETIPVYDSAADLALTVAFLAATGNAPPERLARTVFLGELGLNGGIRPVRGVLPAISAAVEGGLTTVVVPAFFAEITAQVPGAEVIPAACLIDVLTWLRDGPGEDTTRPTPARVTPPIQVDRRARQVTRVGERVLVRPFLRIPIRPWWAEPYQSPFYYPGTVVEITDSGRVRVELDEPHSPAPWESRLQLFHPTEIHRYGCRCLECAKPGQDVPRFLADQAQLTQEQ
ncbi:hypothetical protein LDL08_19835 [Nonomuraea glycinis]|uniref:Lon proteolytic domain-containing protein n=1 Tax=Nonomuraea glycinis TaxID=2047744 RepID=A0A918E8V2_9ACTN|nr:ATP-binding protein [Nonomuraea glycinis]MCA2178443.1 hypothetical protein [Nonomuraea glycinis]GGP12250.1 hypothetical protein GCM10012278_59260 [Nonomuraea glycinis]